MSAFVLGGFILSGLLFTAALMAAVALLYAISPDD